MWNKPETSSFSNNFEHKLMKTRTRDRSQVVSFWEYLFQIHEINNRGLFRFNLNWEQFYNALFEIDKLHLCIGSLQLFEHKHIERQQNFLHGRIIISIHIVGEYIPMTNIMCGDGAPYHSIIIAVLYRDDIMSTDYV